MSGLIGKKIGMTHVFSSDGTLIPVTVVQAGPCIVTQVKTLDKDGYNAVQLGFGEKKIKKINKPQAGHLKKAHPEVEQWQDNKKEDKKKTSAKKTSKAKEEKYEDKKIYIQGTKILKEFRTNEEVQLGDTIKVDIFSVGDKVNVCGISKGRGFQGTIKRHGFSRGPETHGNRNHRKPGSIGNSAWPGKVVKGKKLPGHMGSDQKTLKNLTIVDIKFEDNLILIKGALPGYKTGILKLVKIR